MSTGPFPVLDRGAPLADDDPRFGVFDTLLAEEGVAWFAERHLARLRATCLRFGIDAFERFDVPRDVAEFVARLDGRTALVRTSLFGGPQPALAIRARTPRAVPAAGVELLPIAFDPDPRGSWKTTDRSRRSRAGEAAERAGAFDALLVLPGGEVVEVARGNLFAVVDGVVVTPPLSAGALPGIVRGLLLESLTGAVERRLGSDDLRRASEVWITSSGLRCAPVTAVRGLGSGLAGPRGEAYLAARRALAAREAAYRANTPGP